MAAWQRYRLASAVFGVGVLALLGAAPAGAQAPPYPPGPPPVAAPPPPPVAAGPAPPLAGPPGEAAQIAGCLCERQQIDALSADMEAKKHALAEVRQQLADLDAQLERARPSVDVNSPDSVERYKALLERHDQAYRRSIGPIVGDAMAAVNAYNERVNAYNQSCGHQLFDAALMAQVRATLACPAPR